MQKMKKGGKAGDTDKDIKKRERKVFHLPGQKRDPPEERDPLRIFYETLYKQVPTSEMASIWMMEFGLLSKDEAKKVFEKKQKRAQQQKLGTPTKTVVVKKKAESVTIVRKSAASPISVQKKKTASSKVVTKQSKKRKSKDNSSEDDTDEDFGVGVKKEKKRRTS
ncbi:uncharacterized protein [Primulina huaijiensis]|uniref:uncharacterized protein n=1 Tax=Primulina huaijiensis TaxID=1492673 RepID=UPI003CC6E8C4